MFETYSMNFHWKENFRPYIVLFVVVVQGSYSIGINKTRVIDRLKELGYYITRA